MPCMTAVPVWNSWHGAPSLKVQEWIHCRQVACMCSGHRHLLMHIHSGLRPVPDQILDRKTTATPIAYEALPCLIWATTSTTARSCQVTLLLWSTTLTSITIRTTWTLDEYVIGWSNLGFGIDVAHTPVLITVDKYINQAYSHERSYSCVRVRAWFREVLFCLILSWILLAH